jgi:hypothetical protein
MLETWRLLEEPLVGIGQQEAIWCTDNAAGALLTLWNVVSGGIGDQRSSLT